MEAREKVSIFFRPTYFNPQCLSEFLVAANFIILSISSSLDFFWLNPVFVISILLLDFSSFFIRSAKLTVEEGEGPVSCDVVTFLAACSVATFDQLHL